MHRPDESRLRLKNEATTESEDALIHTIQELQYSGYYSKPQLLQCTSPFTTSNDIDLAIADSTTSSLNSSFAAMTMATSSTQIRNWNQPRRQEARKRRQDLGNFTRNRIGVRHENQTFWSKRKLDA